MTTRSEYDAIIVGGGHNGLVAAGYLARAGMSVLVLERRHIVGGACATEELFTTGRVEHLDEFFELDILKACLVRSGDAGDPRAIGSAIPYISEALRVTPDDQSDYFSGVPKGGVGVITQAMARSTESVGV